ncbi:hypothetical protein [Nostoc sp. ATCC 53789]|uniref:hypothetical protein n=1 Tax=Nostoc sp. ATCC 53789 TaxID=76335 RepID=UPI0011BE24D3|nr:hypothetical protein [Nostoc sp. ATCC 53789]QHG16693.1 hypothetical protein GJB62_12390 [Nostoc sp. ATCC 53789]
MTTKSCAQELANEYYTACKTVAILLQHPVLSESSAYSCIFSLALPNCELQKPSVSASYASRVLCSAIATSMS